MIYICTLFFLLFAVLEGKRLFHNRWWKEAGVSLLLFLVAGLYAVDFILESGLLFNPNVIFTKLLPVLEAYDAFFDIPR